ncbi:hypothetical protein F7734_23885 [Scytonema sp. UIC 10036]|uniref:hypothetical protein n=1 Tax=Scytonema sp. UIC 10036 TaxID=2304196 RepID=UPI0012DABB19|nr:hypothetical protein [Scytonema sp. UIC 10036]MUG95235.1 hypothetical protein [Scytonema sp. UIC 10036]
MKNLLAQQTKFNTRNIVKLGLISLALSLSLGTNTQARAGEVEVLSIPPQEAFFIEEKTATTSGNDNTASQGVTKSTDETTLPGKPYDEENLQSFGNTANSSPVVPQASSQVQM